LICSALLLLFIKSMGETKLGAVQFFGNFLMGWHYNDALKLLALVILLAASAATIWTGYGFDDPKKVIYKGKGPRLFFAGFPEIYRFGLFVYLITFLWALGFLAITKIYNYDSHKDIVHLTILTARAMLPLVALLPFAILRLRIMGPVTLVAVGTVAYLMGTNSSPRAAAVFVGIPVAVAAVFLIVRYFTVPAYLPAVEAAAGAPDTSTSAGKTEGAEK
jgi:hypothetical protein